MTGDVRLRFEPGACTVVGRRSEHSLYDLSLATYGSGDAFDQSHAEGYVRLYGLPLKVWSAKQGTGRERVEPSRSGRRRSGRAGSRRRRRPRRTRSGRSLQFDVRLAPQDVDVSIAHVARAARTRACSTPTKPPRSRRRWRRSATRSPRDGSRSTRPTRTCTRRSSAAVTERLGDVGAKLHAGRRRNDLVVTDLRLWLLAAGRASTASSRARRARWSRARASTRRP